MKKVAILAFLLALAVSDDVFYYTTRDFRKCAFPICGGFFAWEANKDSTTCPRDRNDFHVNCYVAGATPDILVNSNVVLGSISRSTDPSFQRFPVLDVTTAWQPTTPERLIEDPTSVTFYKLSQTGVVCVTRPCFTMNAIPLNANVPGRSRAHQNRITISISDLGGDERLIEAAQQEIASRPVIVIGTISNEANGGRLLTLTHDVFRENVPELRCSADSDCTFTIFHTLVTSGRDCYCPACPDYAVSTETATKNEAAYNRFCEQYRADNCPLFRCVAPPEATCSNGRCCCNRV